MNINFLEFIKDGTNQTYYLLLVILLLFGLSISTRLLPFWFQGFFSRSQLLRRVGNYLPGVIMLLLVFLTLDDIKWQQIPYGLPEISSLLVAIGLYIWKRNLLLALLPSTIMYILIINYTTIPWF